MLNFEKDSMISNIIEETSIGTLHLAWKHTTKVSLTDISKNRLFDFNFFSLFNSQKYFTKNTFPMMGERTLKPNSKKPIQWQQYFHTKKSFPLRKLKTKMLTLTNLLLPQCQISKIVSNQNKLTSLGRVF